MSTQQTATRTGTLTLIRASQVVPRLRTHEDMVCGHCDGLFPSKAVLVEHERIDHPEQDFYRARRPKITKGEPLMTRDRAVELIADALQGLAQAADVKLSRNSHIRRAEWLLHINNKIDGRLNTGTPDTIKI